MIASGCSSPIMAGYSVIQLKTSGRANPVPDLNTRTTLIFELFAASRRRISLSPTAIIESPTSATVRGRPVDGGCNGARGVIAGTPGKTGAAAPRTGACTTGVFDSAMFVEHGALRLDAVLS